MINDENVMIITKLFITIHIGEIPEEWLKKTRLVSHTYPTWTYWD